MTSKFREERKKKKKKKYPTFLKYFHNKKIAAKLSTLNRHFLQ